MVLPISYILVTALSVSPITLAADSVAPSLESEQPPTAPPTPETVPSVPPSRIDPGIQKQPSTIPDPRAVVPPPVVDPKMTIDPESNPRTGKTNPRPNPDGPPFPGQPPGTPR